MVNENQVWNYNISSVFLLLKLQNLSMNEIIELHQKCWIKLIKNLYD